MAHICDGKLKILCDTGSYNGHSRSTNHKYNDIIKMMMMMSLMMMMMTIMVILFVSPGLGGPLSCGQWQM